MFKVGENNLLCTDVQASQAFYTDVLGFTVVGEEDGAVRLKKDGRFLLLLPVAKNGNPTQEYGPVAGLSFDLLVSDLASAIAYLKEKGVEFARDWNPGDEPYAVIKDPDGVFIEVVQDD